MTSQTHDPEGSTIEHKQSELREIRSELRRKQSWIDDDEELYQEVTLWILESHDLPMGSIQARIQSRLLSLQDQPKHKLRPHRGVDDAEEAFPEECEDCTHYGGRCPILAKKVGRDTLERHFNEAESDEELLGRLSQFAGKHHCEVLVDEIERGQSQYREFVKSGEHLRARVNANVSDMDLTTLDETAVGIDEEGGEAVIQDTAESMQNIPSEDVAERVAEVTESVTSDDGEDDDAI